MSPIYTHCRTWTLKNHSILTQYSACVYSYIFHNHHHLSWQRYSLSQKYPSSIAEKICIHDRPENPTRCTIQAIIREPNCIIHSRMRAYTHKLSGTDIRHAQLAGLVHARAEQRCCRCSAPLYDSLTKSRRRWAAASDAVNPLTIARTYITTRRRVFPRIFRLRPFIIPASAV